MASSARADPAADLAAVDAIMEPQILASLKQFISTNGGQKDVVMEAIRLVSESYRGLAQICTLLTDWMVDIVGDRREDLDELVMDNLKELAFHQFDKDKADSIFSVPQGQPDWLSFMICDPGWRSLLYRLSQEHPNCLLLEFTLQSCPSDELAANATRSGNLQFPVFRNLFRDQLSQIWVQVDEAAFKQRIAELKRLCCQTQYMYMFSQYMLTGLARHPQTGYLWRLLQHELMEHAFSQVGDRARSVDAMLTSSPRFPSIHRCLSSLNKGGRLTPVDIKNIYDLYASNNPPPVDLIRTDMIIRPLIEALFCHNHRTTIQISHKQYSVYLLAYAACVKDNREWYAGDPTKSSVDSVVEKSQMNSTITALNDVLSVCEDPGFGFHIGRSESTLRKHVSVPVCSAGILHWVQQSLLSTEYYSTTYQSVCTPMLIRLLGVISALHSLQRRQVFDMLCAAFHLRTDLDDLAAINFRKMILEVLIHLVHCGLLLEVIEMVISNVPRMDHSLVRFFIVQIIDTTAPPYSPTFARGIFQVALLPGATLALRNDQDSMNHMKRFATVVAKMDMDLSDLHDQILTWRGVSSANTPPLRASPIKVIPSSR